VEFIDLTSTDDDDQAGAAQAVVVQTLEYDFLSEIIL
jgi:hypothetical protein